MDKSVRSHSLAYGKRVDYTVMVPESEISKTCSNDVEP